jgi:hypothetical protein
VLAYVLLFIGGIHRRLKNIDHKAYLKLVEKLEIQQMINNNDQSRIHYKLWAELSQNMSLIPLHGKRPIEKNWQRYCDEIRVFDISFFKNHNAGVCCGPASNLLVLDIDEIKTFESACKSHGWVVPETYEVVTGGGGTHYYFLYPADGKKYGNKSCKKLGFDIRGSGGQVVAAGSTHPDTGRIYSIAKNLPIVPPPQWMLDLYEKSKKEHIKTTNVKTIKLSSSAQPPTDKFIILCEIEPRFKASWEMRRPDLSDQSSSGYDMSLACFAVATGWTDQEVSDLLVSFAMKHGHDMKKRVKGNYIHQTIDTARSSQGGEGLKLSLMAELSSYAEASSVFDNIEKYARLPLKDFIHLKMSAKKNLANN